MSNKFNIGDKVRVNTTVDFEAGIIEGIVGVIKEIYNDSYLVSFEDVCLVKDFDKYPFRRLYGSKLDKVECETCKI